MTHFKSKKSTKIILASVLALIIIAVAGVPARAGVVGAAIGPIGTTILGAMGLNADKIAINAVTGIIGVYVQVVSQVTVGIIGSSIALFQYNNFVNAKIVTVGWNLTRDITNMVFVIMFLVMAFYTVLGKDEYSARKFLVRLVVAAVLVNFSRTIAGLIIDFSQVVMLTFVNGFLAVAGGNFVQAFGMEKIMQPQTNTEGAQLLGSYILGAILVTVMFFVIISMLVMLLARIIMLWILVILSPFAFVATVLPGKLGEEAKKWWGYFINYNMAGPILAFFVWLTLYYMNYLQAGNWDPEQFKFPDVGDKTTFSSLQIQTLFFGCIMSTIMLLIGVKMAAGTKVFGADWAQKGVDGMKKGAAKAGKAIGGWAGRGALRQTEGTRLKAADFMAKIPGLRTLAFATRGGVQKARAEDEKKKLAKLDTATPQDLLRMWKSPALRTAAGEAALRTKIMKDPRAFNQMSAGESMTLLDQEKKRLRAAKDTKGLEEVQGAEYKRLRGMSLDERLNRRQQLIARGASADEIETSSRALMDDPIARRKLLNRTGGLAIGQEMMRGSRDYAKSSGKIENFDQLLNIEKASPQLIDAQRRMADDYHYDINSGTFTNPATKVEDEKELLSTFRAPDGGTNFANFAGAAQNRGSAFIATAMEGLTAGQIIRLRTRDDLLPEQDLAVRNLIDDLLASNDPALADKAERVRNNEQYITGAGGRQHRRGRNQPPPTIPPPTGGGPASGGAPPTPIVPPPPTGGGAATPTPAPASTGGGPMPRPMPRPRPGGAAPSPTRGGGTEPALTPAPTPAPSPAPTPAPPAPKSVENLLSEIKKLQERRDIASDWAESAYRARDAAKKELEDFDKTVARSVAALGEDIAKSGEKIWSENRKKIEAKIAEEQSRGDKLVEQEGNLRGQKVALQDILRERESEKNKKKKS